MQMPEIGLRQCFVRAGAPLGGLAVLGAGGTVSVGSRNWGAFAVVLTARACAAGALEGAHATATTLHVLTPVRWQEPRVEEIGEALLISRSPAEQRLGGPSQDQRVQHTYPACCLDEQGGVVYADRKTVFAEKGDETCEAYAERTVER